MNTVIVFGLFLIFLNCGFAQDLHWWEHQVFYQIYPRSFKDSNNDGVGDLRGIIEKLPYFREISIEAIWLSPIFESPGVDQGYDISNYTKVDPLFGTNDDLIDLIEVAHKLGIKVILDFVPNHTSDKHQWFLNSVKKVPGYEDFYVWRDGKPGPDGKMNPPNNWISVFKNSSWKWSDERQQYYLHQFAYQQPDLNYRNPKVVEAMKGVMKFWLDKGVDGFRVDAVPYLFEDPNFEDEPLSHLPGYDSNDYEYLIHTNTYNLNETFEMIYEWRRFLDQYTTENGGDQRIMMTEAYAGDQNMLYYGKPDGSELGAHFAFNFNLITGVFENSTATDIVNQITPWLTELPSIYIPNWVLGNHDNHRVATRLGPDNVDGFNMLVLLLPGIAVTYNGEEIGQENGEVSYEEGQDPSARDPSIFDKVSRDFERTPYQWDTTVNAGFNDGAKPWLPVSSKYLETNLANQKVPGKKMHFNLYAELILMRAHVSNGATEIVALTDDVLLLSRSVDIGTYVLLFNVGNKAVTVDASKYIYENNSLIISSVNSNHDIGDEIVPSAIKIQPHESFVVRFNY